MKIPDEGRIVVSACLTGIACTHAAEAKTRDWAVRLVAEGRAIPVCPEVAGGLPIPRPAAEIQRLEGQGGASGADVIDGEARVIDENGVDVTENYLEGARKAARASEGLTLAVLKARSPSCGCGQTYDGTFTGTLHDADGVTAAMLKRQGLTVISDEEVG